MTARAQEYPKAFERFAGAHTTSAAGDTLIAVALAGTLFFDVPIGEARTRVALYLLLTMAPFSVLAPMVGPLLDRLRGGHRIAVVVAAAGRAGLAAFMITTTDTLLLYPAAFSVLVLSRAHAVARAALVPAFLGTERGLVAANGRLARVAVLGGVVAAGPGIGLQLLFGPGGALALATVAFALTAIAATALPRPPRSRGGDDEPVIEPTAGVPPGKLHRALVANAIIRGAGGLLLFLLAFGLRELGVATVGFGLVLAASGLGSFIGATYVPRLRRAGNEEWILVVSLVAGAGTAIIASRDFGTDLAALLGGAIGLLTNAGRLAFDSIAQRAIPAYRRARAFSRFETLFQLSWVCGALIPVLIPLGIEPGLWLVAGLLLGGAGWYLASLGMGGRRDLSA